MNVIGDHCINTFNRVNNRSELLAGNCLEPGNSDGESSVARFTFPQLFIMNPECTSLLGLEGGRLRSININTRQVKTLLRSGLNNPFAMTWDNDVLLVGNYGYIIQVIWNSDGTVGDKIIAGVKNHQRDNTGAVQDATFRNIKHITTVFCGIYLYGNDVTLQLLDLQNLQVLTVETSGFSTKDYFFSVLKTDTALYIVQHEKIVVVKG